MKDDLFVLHLSDLHIRNEGSSENNQERFSGELSRLLDDIKEQTKYKSGIIVVVSGDIIDQGKYDKHRSAAIKFFKKLYQDIGTRVKDIIIVPGNHDKCRTKINTLISMSHTQLGLENDGKEADLEWKTQMEAYSDYFRLIEDVNEIFQKPQKINNTFGVDIVTVESASICFLKLDTAWCSYSKNDKRHLRIGAYQLRKLLQKYRFEQDRCKNEGTPIELTIAISHYPLNWLDPQDEDACNSYFLSGDYLNVDVLMCGHVHDFSVANSFNHTHSLLTLVTGIGWGSEEPTKHDDHRYSIYTFNLRNNSCDIVMRKTKGDGNFDYDYSVYVGAHELADGKLRYPLRTREGSPFIRINSPSAIEAKSLFLNSDILNQIPITASAMSRLASHMAKIYRVYQDDYLNDLKAKLETEDKLEDGTYNAIEKSMLSDEPLSQDLQDQFFKSKEMFPSFLGFLNELCTQSVQTLSTCFSDNTIIRAHFRWHNFESTKKNVIRDEYCLLCQDSNLPPSEKKDGMQSVPWESMIKNAYESGAPVIYSANERYNRIETQWEDFVTMIPKFSDNSHDVQTQKMLPSNRPILTFGLSIQKMHCRNDTISFYLLSYLRIDNLVAQIINDYINMFHIDAKRILSYIKDIKNNGEKEKHQ